MSDAFDKLKATLAEKDMLTEEEISAAVAEYGEITPEERMWLSAEIHKREQSKRSTVTMEQFLQANHVLDNADPDSDEYKTAQEIVDAFLQGS